MAVTQEIFPMDEYFASVRGGKIIVNDIKDCLVEDNLKLNNALQTVYDKTDTLSTKPSCDCGKTDGRYNIGRICPVCSTTCSEPHEKVEPVLWFMALDNDHLFLNPTVWLMIRNLVSKKYDFLRWLCDNKYNPPMKGDHQELRLINEWLEERKMKRSYRLINYHLGDILRLLMCMPKLIKDTDKLKQREKEERFRILLDMVENQRHIVYSKYLPMINKKLFIIEKTNKGTFVSLVMSSLKKVVTTWSIMCSNIHEGQLPRDLSSKMGRVQSELVELYDNHIDKFIVKKPGVFRKHLFGARSHFTFRTVITSVSGKHTQDEISVPWIIGVTAFRPHVLNKLIRRGFSYKEANKLLFTTIKRYDPVIDEILNELINETPYRGIPVIAQRNPSLTQGSAMLTFIKEFKRDTADLTTSISALIIKYPNGDFDGDELNFTILLDNQMASLFETLSPQYNIPDVKSPYSIAPQLTLLSPANSILTNYLQDTSKSTEPDLVLSRMKLL